MRGQRLDTEHDHFLPEVVSQVTTRRIGWAVLCASTEVLCSSPIRMSKMSQVPASSLGIAARLV